MSLAIDLITQKGIGKCSECNGTGIPQQDGLVFNKQITHNLNNMADAAGIYEAIWRPEEIGIKRAGELVGLLKVGLIKLKKDPYKFKEFNDPDDWGTYDQFVPIVEEYLENCQKYPDAIIEISR